MKTLVIGNEKKGDMFYFSLHGFKAEDLVFSKLNPKAGDRANRDHFLARYSQFWPSDPQRNVSSHANAPPTQGI